MPNYFTSKEISCNCHRDCLCDYVSLATLKCANALREFLGYPVKASSVNRCVDHNSSMVVRDGRKVRLGGVRSFHLPRGVKDAVVVMGKVASRPRSDKASLAMDLHVRKRDRQKAYDFVREHFPDMSIGKYSYGIHIDSGYQHKYRPKPAYWGSFK